MPVGWCNNVPMSPANEMRSISDLRAVGRFRGQTQKNGVTTDWLFAVRADDHSAIQCSLIGIVRSAAAVIFH